MMLLLTWLEKLGCGSSQGQESLRCECRPSCACAHSMQGGATVGTAAGRGTCLQGRGAASPGVGKPTVAFCMMSSLPCLLPCLLRLSALLNWWFCLVWASHVNTPVSQVCSSACMCARSLCHDYSLLSLRSLTAGVNQKYSCLSSSTAIPCCNGLRTLPQVSDQLRDLQSRSSAELAAAASRHEAEVAQLQLAAAQAAEAAEAARR